MGPIAAGKLLRIASESAGPRLATWRWHHEAHRINYACPRPDRLRSHQDDGLPGSSSASSSAAAAPAPVPAGAAGGQANTPSDARPDLVKTYLAVDFKDYAGNPSGYSNAGVVAHAGLQLSSVDGRGNPIYGVTPDATWLPGWDPRSFSSQDLPMQVAQAGINRTWQAACFADFAAFRSGWQQLADKFRPTLEAARGETNFYARTAALRELYVAVGIAATEAGVEVPVGNAGHWLGLRWQIASELLAAISADQRDFARDNILGLIAVDLPTLRTLGRAWDRDEGFERDAFCLDAQDHGTQRTPKLPRPRLTGYELGVVTYPVSGARAAEVATKLRALYGADRPTLADLRVLTPDTLPNPIKAPELTVFDLAERPYVVERVTTKGKQTVVHATSSQSSAVGYACRPTKTIDSVTDGGQVIYRTACKTGTRTDITAVEVTFDELPNNKPLMKGVAIAFYGDVAAYTTSSTTAQGGAKVTHRRTLVVRGRYLDLVATKR